MSKTLSYDPIAALGIRLGTPLGLPFFIEHETRLIATFDAEFVELLRAVIVSNDLAAAALVAGRLTPTATYDIDARPGYIEISYRDGAVDGRSTIRSEAGKAVALVTTAIDLYRHKRQ
jgi:hypothetical protein